MSPGCCGSPSWLSSSMRAFWPPPAGLFQQGPFRIHPDPGQAVPGRVRPASRRGLPRPHGRRHPPNERRSPSGIRAWPRAVAFPGPLDQRASPTRPNAGIVFVTLKPFEERTSKALSGPGHRPAASGANSLRSRTPTSRSFRRRRCMGLGTIGGFKLYVEDRGDNGLDALYGATQGLIAKAYQTPGARRCLLELHRQHARSWTPDVDRVKAKVMGVPLAERLRDDADQSRLALRQRLQPLRPDLPGHRAGRRRVPPAGRRTSCASRPAIAPASLVPLGSLVKVSETYGPD